MSSDETQSRCRRSEIVKPKTRSTLKREKKRRRRPKEGPWSSSETEKFIEAVKLFGKDWYKIYKHIGTRTRSQVASFAQNFRKKEKANHTDIIAILEGPPHGP